MLVRTIVFTPDNKGEYQVADVDKITNKQEIVLLDSNIGDAISEGDFLKIYIDKVGHMTIETPESFNINAVPKIIKQYFNNA